MPVINGEDDKEQPTVIKFKREEIERSKKSFVWDHFIKNDDIKRTCVHCAIEVELRDMFN